MRLQSEEAAEVRPGLGPVTHPQVKETEVVSTCSSPDATRTPRRRARLPVEPDRAFPRQELVRPEDAITTLVERYLASGRGEARTLGRLGLEALDLGHTHIRAATARINVRGYKPLLGVDDDSGHLPQGGDRENELLGDGETDDESQVGQTVQAAIGPKPVPEPHEPGRSMHDENRHEKQSEPPEDVVDIRPASWRAHRA